MLTDTDRPETNLSDSKIAAFVEELGLLVREFDGPAAAWLEGDEPDFYFGRDAGTRWASGFDASAVDLLNIYDYVTTHEPPPAVSWGTYQEMLQPKLEWLDHPVFEGLCDVLRDALGPIDLDVVGFWLDQVGPRPPTPDFVRGFLGAAAEWMAEAIARRAGR